MRQAVDHCHGDTHGVKQQKTIVLQMQEACALPIQARQHRMQNEKSEATGNVRAECDKGV